MPTARSISISPVSDRKPRRVGFGAELSNRDGVTLSGFWLHRNILGGAEKLRVDGEIAQIGTDGDEIDYRFSTRFEKPAAFGPDTLAFAQVELSYEDEPSYLEKRARLSAGLTHEFSPELTGGLGLGAGLFACRGCRRRKRIPALLGAAQPDMGQAHRRDRPAGWQLSQARRGAFLRR